VRAKHTYSYAILRVVPRVDRGEFINAGIILWCPKLTMLEAEILLDEERLKSIDPSIDMEEIRNHLSIIPAICRGEDAGGAIAKMPLAQRFGWLTATRSTVIQTSPVHMGQCEDPALIMKQLITRLVFAPGKC
jgi:hypothetical protein